MNESEKDERIFIPRRGEGRDLPTATGYDGTHPYAPKTLTTTDGNIRMPARGRDLDTDELDYGLPSYAPRLAPPAVRDAARSVPVGTTGQIVEGEAVFYGYAFANDSGSAASVEFYDRSLQGTWLGKANLPDGVAVTVANPPQVGVVIHNLYVVVTGTVKGVVFVGGME